MKLSANKGKSYERRISKLLSTWCGFELIRTPMSGAWQGTSGDIKPKDASVNFPFVIECKKQEKWNMEQVLANEGVFKSWVEQAAAEIEKDVRNGKHVVSFLLIFSRNHKSDYIAVPATHTTAGTLALLNYCSVRIDHQHLYIFDLHEFMSKVAYHTLLQSLKN